MKTSTITSKDTWRFELFAAGAIWVAATIVVVLVAPIVVGWPLPVAVTVVIGACAALATAVTGWLRTAGLLGDTHGALRLAGAVVVVGQFLDVVLVACLGGRYPGLTVAQTGRLTLLLMAGYAAFLAASAVFDHAGDRR